MLCIKCGDQMIEWIDSWACACGNLRKKMSLDKDIVHCEVIGKKIDVGQWKVWHAKCKGCRKELCPAYLLGKQLEGK